MKFISLCIQTNSAGLYKSSYFMNKRILYKPLVSRFFLLLRLRSYKLSKFYISNINFLNINLIVNKRVRVLNFFYFETAEVHIDNISKISAWKMTCHSLVSVYFSLEDIIYSTSPLVPLCILAVTTFHSGTCISLKINNYIYLRCCLNASKL